MDREGWRLARELADDFARVPVRDDFAQVLHKVCRRSDGQPVLDPYVPFVGPGYEAGGILVYATAQNLAGVEHRYRDELTPGEAALYRLWDGVAPTGPKPAPAGVGIQPWDDGILPALVGMLNLARTGRPETLDGVRGRTAVSNFYKLSLVDGTRDLNPNGLPRDSVERYARMTWDRFVSRELERLEPALIITFRGAHAAILQKHRPARVRVVNDPAWLKRGGRFREVPAASEVARALAARSLDSCEEPYRTSKRKAAMGYLLRYFAQERASLSEGFKAGR